MKHTIYLPYHAAPEKVLEYCKRVWSRTLRVPEIGEVCTFGKYPQGKNGEVKDIEWIVLDHRGSEVLLISKYGLDCKKYNKEWVYITWENCTLRYWLNDEFYRKAFDSEEQQKIIKKEVKAERNPEYNTDPGKDTQEKIFLLSINEAEKYFDSDEARKCLPTDYAVSQGTWVNSDLGTCWWWLRSPGYSSLRAAGVRSDGDVDRSGSDVYYGALEAVRPALWVNLAS